MRVFSAASSRLRPAVSRAQRRSAGFTDNLSVFTVHRAYSKRNASFTDPRQPETGPIIRGELLPPVL